MTLRIVALSIWSEVWLDRIHRRFLLSWSWAYSAAFGLRRVGLHLGRDGVDRDLVVLGNDALELLLQAQALLPAQPGCGGRAS